MATRPSHLQELQVAHERIVKAMDADKDGTLTLEEMLDLMRGISHRLRSTRCQGPAIAPKS